MIRLRIRWHRVDETRRDRRCARTYLNIYGHVLLGEFGVGYIESERKHHGLTGPNCILQCRWRILGLESYC